MVVIAKLSLISKFGSSHENPEVFVTPQWSREVKKSVWFMIFRLLLAAFYIGTLSYSLATSAREGYIDFYAIYMTHWGLILCTISTTLAAFLATFYQFDVIQLKPQSLSYKVFWFLSNVSTVWAFVITIVYWGLLFNGTTTALDILVHAANALGMFIQLIFVRHPMHFAHVIHPVGLEVVYGLFTVIYYFANGTDPVGNRYIYPILKWGENPGKTGLLLLGVLVLTMFLHFILCIVQRLRHRVHKKIYSSPTSFDITAKNTQQLSV